MSGSLSCSSAENWGLQFCTPLANAYGAVGFNKPALTFCFLVRRVSTCPGGSGAGDGENSSSWRSASPCELSDCRRRLCALVVTLETCEPVTFRLHCLQEYPPSTSHGLTLLRLSQLVCSLPGQNCSLKSNSARKSRKRACWPSGFGVVW